MKFPVHIIILGQEGVGKSALVVRFLTRRFLAEFAETDEIDYERVITLDDRQVSLRITDVSGKSLQTRAASKELLMQADAAILVYSVTDQSSVTAARHALHCIRKYRPSSTSAPSQTPGTRGGQQTTDAAVPDNTKPLPVLLLGNKSDLDHIRTVNRHCEPSDWTTDFTLTAECSARDDADGVRVLFHKLIRKSEAKLTALQTGAKVRVKQALYEVLQTREAGNKGGRKMSHASLGSPKQLRSTIKRRFSMFSRERISTL